MWGEYLTIQLWWETLRHCSHTFLFYPSIECFVACPLLVVCGVVVAVALVVSGENTFIVKTVWSIVWLESSLTWWVIIIWKNDSLGLMWRLKVQFLFRKGKSISRKGNHTAWRCRIDPSRRKHFQTIFWCLDAERLSFFEGASFDVFVVHDFKDGVLRKKMSLKICGKHSQKCNKYKYVSMTQYDCGFAPSKFMGST